MNALGNPLLLIFLAIIIVVLINLLLIASVQSHSKRIGGSTIRRILSSIREPFQEGDSDLDKLADLVADLDDEETSSQSPSKTR